MARPPLEKARVALAHDYLNSWGGGERVLNLFKTKLFPQADVWSITYDAAKMTSHVDYSVKTSPLQKIPFATRFHKWFLVLMPWAVRRMDLASYDLVLSDSSGFVKGVRTRPGALHVCYLHTPTRYLTVDTDYFRESVPRFLHWLMPPFLAYLRRADQEGARQPDVYIANSQETAKRLEKFYKRKAAEIIFPPVDMERFYREPTDTTQEYYLVAGRLAPYKRFDLAIEACAQLNKKLVVIGTGPEESRLKSLAGPNVEFRGKVSDVDLRAAFAECKAMIFPPLEDAGMTPLECMACGRPVIAYGKGGALESVIDGTSGLFFSEQTVESVVGALRRFERKAWDEKAIAAHAARFSADIFVQKVRNVIEASWEREL